jgi:hypothetical protein
MAYRPDQAAASATIKGFGDHIHVNRLFRRSKTRPSPVRDIGNALISDDKAYELRAFRMIQIDLNAPSIPESQRVWRLFPGSGYRFLESFRQQNVGYLDIPGFVFPHGRLSDATDLVARVAASQSIVGEINNDTTNSSLKINLDDFSIARNTKFRGRLKQAIINLYEVAKLNDIVIMPEPKYMSKVWIGRFTQNITSQALYNLKNPNLTITARRIE